MSKHICPRWLGFLIDNPLRRLLHNPDKIFASYVKPGDVVLDLGCGMGWASLGMARMVGPEGRVFAADLQPGMLSTLRQRARRAGLMDRISIFEGQADALDIDAKVNFAVSFWAVHEVPSTRRLFDAVQNVLAPEARFLVVEPRGHVPDEDFAAMIETAGAAGFVAETGPQIALSNAVILRSK